MRKRPSESAVKPPPPKKEVIEIDSSDDDDLDNTLVVIDLTSDGTCERVFLEISDDEDEMKKETPKESAKKKRKKRRSRQSLTPMVVKSKPILPVSERKRIKKRLKAKGKAVSNDDVKEEEHTPLCSFMNKGRRFEIVTRSRSKTLAASPEPEPEPEPELDPERQSHHRYPLRKCISRGPERRIVTLPKETFTVQYDPLERERVEKAIRTLPQLLSQKKLIIFVRKTEQEKSLFLSILLLSRSTWTTGRLFSLVFMLPCRAIFSSGDSKGVRGAGSRPLAIAFFSSALTTALSIFIRDADGERTPRISRSACRRVDWTSVCGRIFRLLFCQVMVGLRSLKDSSQCREERRILLIHTK